MNRPLEELVRPNIRSLTPYRSARQDHLSGILLDANENSFGSVLASNGVALQRYPDPTQSALRQRIAALNGVAPENVFVGVGSDEVIDLLLRIFCDPGRHNVVIPEPSYGMYRVAASIQNVEIRSTLLTDSYQLDGGAIRSMVNDATRLIFCCSPNNPTANVLHAGDILALTQLNAVVAVDEAYIEFSDAPSLASQAAIQNNLVVLRTLSKAWGLAAIRCGYAIAHSDIINWFMRVKPPYNMNALTGAMAFQALAEPERMRNAVQRIREERQWLSRELAALACVNRVFPSDANFLLVRCTNANRIHDALTKQGIIVRNRSTEPKCEQCLRITVGTRPQNELLIAALRGVSA